MQRTHHAPVQLLGLLLMLASTMTAQAADAPSAKKPSLPAGEDGAKQVLETSPRHGEWVDVKLAGDETPIRTWVVYPERKDKAPIVIVIHEIFGLTPWIRGVADQLAADGFIAVAPDLLSGKGPDGGGTESVGSRDEVVALVRSLAAEEVTKRLDAVRADVVDLPAAAPKSATLGFCWGGSQSFAYAAAQPALDAAVVFYGSAPDAAELAKIKAPVLGLYGEDDARVTSTVEPTSAKMKELGHRYEFEVYEGAGHGFLRDQTGRDGANLEATQRAWPRAITFLRTHLEAQALGP